MDKLYPPQIEGTLPAFTKESKVLIVPFVMNKTVSWGEISGFSVKIKSVQNNEVIANYESSQFNKELSQVQFSFEPSDFQLGMFYKLQLAYMTDGKDKEKYGYYSTVGVIKYTEKPEVLINGLTDSQLHTDLRTYIGTYSQEGKDVTEKVYSYNFTIYDEDGRVLETSGEQLHNHENDDEANKSFDSYTIIKALEENKIYTIVYTVTTANGLVQPSPKYRIVQQSTIPPEVEAKLVATMNEENGYVNLQLIGDKDEFGVEKAGTGTFLICRSSSEDNYGSWSEIDRFALFGEAPSSHNWKDFTVQHGFTYIYSLQQYNKDYQIYSDRMLSNEIVANFEHSFLYDGKRQLKIKYNPKVTSFKETVLETKTNTLGGKYPFFFRNGNVAYKEFPISGLISYLSDEEELFLTNEDLLLEDLSNLEREHTLKEGIKSTDYEYFNNMLDANTAYKVQESYRKREQKDSQENRIANKRDRTTNLTDYNIVAERTFKMKVLEFLNNGEPKLFRSPGEGNFIVRLMNSSLTPDDKLSRMIHTFSTTATEIDDFNYQKLNEYGLISTDEPSTRQLRWKTVNIRDLISESGATGKNEILSIGGENNIRSIQCLDMVPGDTIEILLAAPDDEKRIIQIGTTGAYYVEFDEPARQVSISSLSRQGQITYSYYGTSLHHFDTYRYIKMADIPIIQLRRDPVKEKEDPQEKKDMDIREAFGLEDIKYRVTSYYFLNFTKDYNYISALDKELAELKERYVNKEINFDEYEKQKAELIQDYNKDGSLFKFWIDGQEFDITETGDYQLIKPGYIPEIRLGIGVSLDASVQRREIIYDVEETDQSIKNAKDSCIKAYNMVQNYIKFNTIEDSGPDGNDEMATTEDYETSLKKNKNTLERRYNFFLKRLERALEEKEVLAE